MADCPHCQSSMSDDADFCGYCGSRMTAGAEPTRHRDNADVAPEEKREAADTVNQQYPTVPRSEDQDILEQIGRAVAKQLAGGKSKETIVKEFVKDGWTEESATLFVEEVDAQPADAREAPAGVGMKRLILLIVVAGLAINALFIAMQAYEENQNEVEPYLKPFVAEQKTTWDTETVLAWLINPLGLVLGVPVGWGTHVLIKRIGLRSSRKIKRTQR